MEDSLVGLPLANGYHNDDNSLRSAHSAVGPTASAASEPAMRAPRTASFVGRTSADRLQRIESGAADVVPPSAPLPEPSPPPVAASAFAAAALRSRSSTPTKADREAAVGLYLDLRPFMNCAPFAIRCGFRPCFVSLFATHG